MSEKAYFGYYESPELWNQPPTPAQLEIVRTILAYLPEDVQSILDLGSGNGVITNQLVDKYARVCAVDISEEALQYVKSEKKIASVDHLPFHDDEFDLVLITDVLEHLPLQIFEQSIREIQRVAKKYILIVTPFQEKLSFGQTNCYYCKTSFHVNLHIRSITKQLLEAKLTSSQLQQFILCGDEWMHIPTYAEKFKSFYRYANHWDYAICPLCGANQYGQTSTTDPQFYEAIIDTIHDEMAQIRITECHRNEALLLFGKPQQAEVPAAQPQLRLESSIELESVTLKVYDRWSLPVGNPIFSRSNTTYFSHRPYVLIADNMNISEPEEELGQFHRNIVPKENASNHALFILPKFTDEAFDLYVEYKDTSREELLLNIHDRHRSYLQLGKLEAKSDGKWKKQKFTVPKGVQCPPEGFMFELTALNTISQVHPIRLIATTNQASTEIAVMQSAPNSEELLNYEQIKLLSMNSNCVLQVKSNTKFEKSDTKAYIKQENSHIYFDKIVLQEHTCWIDLDASLLNLS